MLALSGHEIIYILFSFLLQKQAVQWLSWLHDHCECSWNAYFSS